MARVLIGFADALQAPEVVFSLLDAGHDVCAFTRKGRKRPTLFKLPIGDPLEIAPPEADAERALGDLRSQLAAGGFDVVLAMDDVALWLTGRAAEGLDVATANAPAEAIAVALDKTRQVEAARAAGIAVPETVFARSPDDVPPGFPFPAIARPSMAIARDGAGLAKGETFYIDKAEDVAKLPTLAPDAAPLIVQPLIRGVGEGVFGFAGQDGVACWFGHRRLRMMNPHGSGASACEAVAPEPALKESAERMISSLGWRGPFMVELLRDADGVAWFVELNGRLWGSTALSRRLGFEYPAWAAAQALEPAFQPAEPAAPGPLQVRHLGRDLLHLLFVLRGPKSDFHRAGWPSFVRSLGAVLRPTPKRRFYNYDPSFPRYYLRDAVATVRAALLGKR